VVQKTDTQFYFGNNFGDSAPVIIQAHSAWPSLRGSVQWVLALPLGKKRRVLRISQPCYQDYGILAYCMLA